MLTITNDKSLFDLGEFGNSITDITKTTANCTISSVVFILFSFTCTSKVVSAEGVAPSTLITVVLSLIETVEVAKRGPHGIRWRWSRWKRKG